MKVAATFCFAVGGWTLVTLVCASFAQAPNAHPEMTYFQSVQLVAPWTAVLVIAVLIIVGGFHLLDLNDKHKGGET